MAQGQKGPGVPADEGEEVDMGRPKTDANGQIVVREEQPKDRVMALAKRLAPGIKDALPSHLDSKRMVRIVMTAMRTTPELLQCDQASFLGSVMSAAQLGLEPNTPLGHCWLVPYKKQCQIILGYQGMIDIAMRSGKVKSIWAHVVRAGDDFYYELGDTPKLRHVPSEDADREEREITHVYAVAKIDEHTKVSRVLSRAQVEKRRRRSQAAHKGPWVTDYEAMCCKTAVRALWQWVPKSAEMAQAAAMDEAPEHGEAQSDLWTPETHEVLESEGLIIDAEMVEEPTEPEEK
jgi:recombination protein RecT